MKNWKIYNRILFIILCPLTLLCLIVGVYFTSSSLKEINENIIARGKSISYHLAIASEYGVLSGNADFLNSIASSSLQEYDVLGVSISNDSGTKLIDLTRNIDRSLFSPLPFLITQTLFGKPDQTLAFKHAISTTAISISDYEYDADSDIASNSQLIGEVKIHISPALSNYKYVLSMLKGGLISALIYIMAVYLSLRIGQQLSTSIEKISDAVEKIEHGNLNTKANIEDGAEIGALAKGINQMGNALSETDKNLRQQIELATRNLRHSYKEIEKQNKRLEHARSIADSANRAKSEFLANISHEIRTPINGIIGFTDVILKTELDQQQKGYVQTVDTASKNLLKLIEDLLDFSRVESGKLSIEKVEFNLRAIIENIYAFYSNSAFSKGVELLVDYDSEIPDRLVSDPIRIEQILINLISNAIKFTDKGSVLVSLRIAEEHKDIFLLQGIIEDTGIGLTAELLEKIHKEFEQKQNITASSDGGTGLGLSITKNIVELLDGNISVYSEKDAGSKFTFNIYCHKHPNAKSHSKPENNHHRFYYFDMLAESSSMYSEIFSEFGQLTKLESHEAIINLKSAEKYDGPLIYSIDASCNTSNVIQSIPKAMFKLAMEKIAFVSSNDPEIHSELKQLGFDRVIPKTINRLLIMDILNKSQRHENQQSPIDNTDFTELKQSRKTILAVDDNEINLKLLSVYLNATGNHVLTAKNGHDAISLLKEHTIDLVFLDLHMPIMDGYETSVAIRQLDPPFNKIPVIGVSADGLPESLHKALDSGMNQYIVKPIKQDDIRQILSKWLHVEDAYKEASLHNESRQILELRDMLRNELPAYKTAMTDAIEQADLQGVFEIAHKIAGGCAYCKLPKLERHAAKLQSAAKQGDSEKSKSALKSLLTVIDDFLATGKP